MSVDSLAFLGGHKMPLSGDTQNSSINNALQGERRKVSNRTGNQKRFLRYSYFIHGGQSACADSGSGFFCGQVDRKCQMKKFSDQKFEEGASKEEKPKSGQKDKEIKPQLHVHSKPPPFKMFCAPFPAKLQHESGWMEYWQPKPSAVK